LWPEESQANYAGEIFSVFLTVVTVTYNQFDDCILVADIQLALVYL